MVEVLPVEDSATDLGTEERGEDVTRLLRWITALVPGDDDQPVATECRGGFDSWYFASEERVEVRDPVASAAVVAVLAPVRNDQVEVADAAARKRALEGARVLRPPAAHRDVLHGAGRT